MRGNPPIGLVHRSATIEKGVDFIGAAVPSRAVGERPAGAEADLSNVIPFARRRRAGPESESPVVAPPLVADRPPRIAERRGLIAVLIGASLAVHAGLLIYLGQEPPPMASIGIEAISVELVLGANTAAGVAQLPSPTEIASAPSPDSKLPEEAQPETAKQDAPRQQPDPEPAATERQPETAPREAVAEQSVPVEKLKTAELAAEAPKPTEAANAAEALPQAETRAEANPQAIPEPDPAEPAAPTRPLMAEPSPAPEAPEMVARPVPVETPEIATRAPAPAVVEPQPQKKLAEKKPVREAAPPPAAKPRAAKPDRKDGENRRDRAAPSSVASTASSGIGIGRSAANSNYRGLVAAHLARYKQYPASARSQGSQGSTTVTFSLSGGGSVTSVRLARGSGNAALDQESVAMVRRASPFPAPPDGRAQTFTVPVSFNIR